MLLSLMLMLPQLSLLCYRGHPPSVVVDGDAWSDEAGVVRLQNRNSVCHSAIIFANALMHKGTTVDAFLRQNLEWLSRATNWAKFSATAGLGVIHSGHLAQVRFLQWRSKPAARAVQGCLCICKATSGNGGVSMRSQLFTVDGLLTL
jgi:hypothetical protein